MTMFLILHVVIELTNFKVEDRITTDCVNRSSKFSRLKLNLHTLQEQEAMDYYRIY